MEYLSLYNASPDDASTYKITHYLYFGATGHFPGLQENAPVYLTCEFLFSFSYPGYGQHGTGTFVGQEQVPEVPGGR